MLVVGGVLQVVLFLYRIEGVRRVTRLEGISVILWEGIFYRRWGLNEWGVLHGERV